ncbi:MAG: V-type ATPase subunit [Acidiferrobacterales bacterium]
MGAIARFAYLNTRVSGMAARLLSDSSVDALIGQASDQENGILQAAGFDRPGANDVTDSGLSLEQWLISSLLADFVILVRPLTGAPRKFLIYWAYRFELSNLKTILRGKMTGQPSATIERQLADMGPFATLPVDELLRTDDVAELLRRLEGTPFMDIARQARRILEEHRELFALDAAVDRRYYADLSRHANAIKRADGEQVRSLVGNIIDRVNLLWLLRYRFAYGLSPAEAYYLLVPAGRQLRSPQLLLLSKLPTFEEVIAKLPRPFAGPLAGVTSASDATLILERDGWRLAETTLRHSSFNLARVFAYLLLREKMLRQLRAVIKGRQLRMHPEQIREATGLAVAGAG